MSSKLVGMVLDADIPHHLKIVLVILADHTNGDTGRCDPSIERVAKRAGCDPRTAQRNISKLIDMAVLHRVVRPGKSSSFVINSKTLEGLNLFADEGGHSESDPRQNATPDNSTPLTPTSPHPRHGCHPTPDTHVTQTGREPEENRKEPPLPPSGVSPHGGKDALEADFEEWWLLVPRKVGKGAARRAYRTARKKTDHATLLSKIAEYAKITEGRDMGYVCHPATWLNGERWLDAPEAESNADAINRMLREGLREIEEGEDRDEHV